MFEERRGSAYVRHARVNHGKERREREKKRERVRAREGGREREGRRENRRVTIDQSLADLRTSACRL